MSLLYPLKFSPILKERLWGGQKLESFFDKDGKGKNIGESWEISSVEDNISVVSNGYLKGNSLQELIEVYMGDLVGDKVYDKFGVEFPLLFKFIDAAADLSIQVHPDDEYARKKHSAFGKTEMWYILDSDEDSYILSGFNKDVNKEHFLKSIENDTIINDLKKIETKPGMVFLIPPGRIHSIGKGVLLAEIQQTSDITYRVYDWNRKDSEGNTRELNIEFARDVISYSINNENDVEYSKEKNTRVDISSNKYFTTSRFDLDKPVSINYELFDSFMVYMCIDGEMEIDYEGEDTVNLKKGESVLIPAELTMLNLTPVGTVSFLEVYII